MPIVEFQPTGKSVNVPRGTELVDAAHRAGVEIEAPCGGKGTCGQCIVRVTSGRVNSDSLGHLPSAAVAEGYVLACRTQVLDTPITVDVPEKVKQEGGQFSDDETDTLVRQELKRKEWDFDPLALQWLLQVFPPQAEDGLSDLDRLVRAIQKDWGPLRVVCTLSVLRKLADTLRVKDGLVTVTLNREPHRLLVVSIEPGDITTRHYAIAVDVGTTTIAVQLINLNNARTLGTRSDYNAQTACGLDVISRINYARKPERLEELRTRALDTINKLIQELAESHGVDSQHINNAVISGNTVMMHLLLGLNPEYIRLDPYTPTMLESPYLSAGEVGLNINPASWIYLSPSVGSYVGGDITAGLLCTDLARDTDELNLFIDIGTNGELVVGNSEFLMGCACSAGPAFEGGGIECGMRAALGAIEQASVDQETGRCRVATIGNVAPLGICGSGMIDLLANLLLTGWLDPAGKFNRERSSPWIKVEGKRARYIIVPDKESPTGEAISITEVDIENIIRAKAAIYSACRLMLNQLEIAFSDLTNIYIAGGFGRFLNLEKAVTIGLIPDIPRKRFQHIGNASLVGSHMVVLSQDYRERQLELAKRMTYVDLSNDPGYMDQYTGALFLPHTDMTQFPSVEKALCQTVEA